MKKLITCILALATVHCSHESSKTEFHCLGVVREYKISKDSVTGRNEKFVEHVGAKKFENYVVISLPYSVFDPLFENLQKDFGALKSRGEAHVTIITPPEFDEVLSSYLTMTEINKIAEETKIQNAKLEPICVGKGEAVIGGKNEATYFVVLESKDILAFRQRIFKEFVKKGGARSRFDPENFYPHVTIGFSLRDLHESDGVRKGKNACVGQLTPK